jgi:riboflavin synthase
MFTGIIEEIGEVVSVDRMARVLLWDGTEGEGFVLVVRAAKALDGAYVGCSIAVNGVCLTVTELTDSTFAAHLAPET